MTTPLPFRQFAVLLMAAGLGLTACAARPGALARPNGAAPAPDDGAYVMDFGNYRIAQTAADGRLLQSIGSFGPAVDQLFFGWDLAVDSAGNIYVCNQVRDNANPTHDGVKEFSAAGRFVREIGATDYPAGSQRFNSPYGLDVDAAGRVYTADYGAATVRVFDPQGQLLGVLFGQVGQGEGQFNGLNDVAVDDSNGFLYVSDNFNSRIQQFKLSFDGGTAAASFVRAFGSYGRAAGQFAYPQFLAVDDSSGQLYVGDVANRRVQVFDSSGKYLRAQGAPAGVADWQVMGLNLAPDGSLYAADGLNNAVWVFGTDGAVKRRIEVRP
jgi:DNA-binding beta-propeller fold protein YncE